MIEAQIAHVAAAVRFLRTHGAAACEPTPEAQAAFAGEVDRMTAGTAWTDGHCDSWYLDATGRNSAIWPGTVAAFRRRVEPFRPSDHLFWHEPARRPARPSAAVYPAEMR